MMPEKSPSDRDYQKRFWDDEAASARFSHPVDERWLRRVAQTDSRILDYGCGYGRTLAELTGLGYANLTGLDISTAMLDRAAKLVPDARLVLASDPPAPLDDSSFDLVLLLAMLTSIPTDDRQRAVVDEIVRLLKPGGHLIVSDLLLQNDPRRVARYENSRPEGLPYGSFELEDGGAVMRHHTVEWLEELLQDFHLVDKKMLLVPTMRGNPARTIQMLLRKGD